MAKKNKKTNRQEETVTVKKSSQTKVSAKSSRANPPSTMSNWLLVFICFFPFVFYRMNMDPVLSLRFTLLGGFLTLFVLYFYTIRKKLLTTSYPFLVKLAFLLGIAYGLWNIVSLSQAINKQQVYYGLSRHFLDMLLLFVLTNMAEQEEGYLVNICKALSLVALIHFIIGLSQFYDGAFTDIPGNFPPYSVMANRNFFGSAQVMLLPFVIFVLYKSLPFWKVIASLALVGIIGSAILSQTRSSWIATSVMLVISMILIIIYSPVNRKKWIIGTIATFFVSVLLGWFLISTDQEGEFAESIKERTGNMFKSDTASTSSAAGNVSERLKIWHKTMDVIKDNPVTGVGAGNWKIIVAKYGSEGLVWEKGDYIPDSTHNDYLLVAAESGIPGAVFYFGMWILIGWMGFKTLMRTQNMDRKVFSILLLAGLAGYAFDSMFSFPMERMEHTLYLYLSAGILLGLYINEFQGEKKRQSLSPALIVIMLIIAGFATFLGFKKMSFEEYVIRSKSLEEQKAYQQSVEDGLKGENKFANIAPNGFPIEAYVGLSYKGLKKYPEALKEMRKGLKYHPYNKALYVNIGTTFSDMGQHDSAIKYYDKALELTPKMNIILFNKAASQYRLGDYRGSLESLKKADLTGYPNMEKMKNQLEDLVKKDSSTLK